jgi:hypothetical protein
MGRIEVEGRETGMAGLGKSEWKKGTLFGQGISWGGDETTRGGSRKPSSSRDGGGSQENGGYAREQEDDLCRCPHYQYS